MPNLIVILFNLMYLVFYVGFLVRVVCERERVCEDSRQSEKQEVFTGSSREAFPQSEACAEHMIRIRRFRTRW